MLSAGQCVHHSAAPVLVGPSVGQCPVCRVHRHLEWRALDETNFLPEPSLWAAPPRTVSLLMILPVALPVALPVSIAHLPLFLPPPTGCARALVAPLSRCSDTCPVSDQLGRGLPWLGGPLVLWGWPRMC